MISTEVFLAYSLACILIILSPGPDNLLVIGRGLSQGRVAAAISAFGAGMGLMVHVFAAAFGLALLIKTSAIAFTVVKVIGAAYLIWLGLKALRTQDLISFTASTQLSYGGIFKSGFLTNVLNPKPAIFILAFVPQFLPVGSNNVLVQSLLLGGWFALLSIIIFSILGLFASSLATYLKNRPRTVFGLNIGAGLTFIGAGVSVSAMER